MPFWLVEADLTSNSKWPPDMSTMSNVFTCFILGTKHHKKRVKVSFPTNYIMAFLFMESDLTSDPIWLQPTMSNVQTCPVWVSITQNRKTVKVQFSTKFGMPIQLVESGMTLESRWPPVHHM